MDVSHNTLRTTRLLHDAGTMPPWRPSPLPAGLLTSVAGGGGRAAAATSAPAEVRGAADGPDLVLASGVHVRLTRFGPTRVSIDQARQAIQAINQLPLADQRAVAQAGVAIELVPASQLEQVAGTTDPVLGATSIVPDPTTGVYTPRAVRVAVSSPLSKPGSANAIGEVTQHEIGHVIAMLRSQDRSEAAAERYARTY